MVNPLKWFPRFWQSKISTVGVAITTMSGLLLVGAIAADFASMGLNVYATALFFLVTPIFFIGGLLLIPLGLILKHRSDLKHGRAQTSGIVREVLSRPRVRRTLYVLGGATVLNVAIVAIAGSKAMSYMETAEFCGTLCHDIMEPEYVAYQRSAHSRVACVECHIGPGASWAVRSKLDGLRQVWHAFRGDYSRPIHAPVHHLRPARDTCEQCHRPDKFHGNRIFARAHYAEDEDNSLSLNVLTLRIGGRNVLTGEYEGIHWHVGADTQVRYEALDDKREKIGKVQVLKGGTVVAEYLPTGEDASGEAQEVREVRVMDCVDCHNRPTHQFDGSPNQALDIGFSEGILSAETPFLKAMALPLLENVERSREGAEKEYEAELRAAYAREHPDLTLSDEQYEAAAAGLAALYRRNIWPRMKIGWDTYPTHIGHAGALADVRGCFRCHDEKHATSEGKVLSQDCELCHQMLADEEAPEDLEESLRAMLFRPDRR
jgi:nitrate/TMAO reductase-like tetraheme cytochrome c subunit